MSEDFGYDFDGDGYDESNMLTSVGGNDLVDWDDNGNLVCDGVSSFEYNYDNKMYGASCIAEPNIFVAVGYDCENNRVSRISGDANGNFTSRKYILDYSGGLPKVLVELESDGGGWSVVARNYHYGDRLISSVDGSGSSRFYVHDRNGNVRNVINSSGSVLNSYSYTPYGEDIAAQCAEMVENRWKYTGQYEDREIGQYYLRARQYSPYLARFNGYDPVYGDYSEPFTLHQYLYCLNDPVNRYDPDGRFSLGGIATGAAIGASLNGLSAYASGERGLGLLAPILKGAIAGGLTSSFQIGIFAKFAGNSKIGMKAFEFIYQANKPGRRGMIKGAWAGISGGIAEGLVDGKVDMERLFANIAGGALLGRFMQPFAEHNYSSIPSVQRIFQERYGDMADDFIKQLGLDYFLLQGLELIAGPAVGQNIDLLLDDSE